MSFLLTKTCNEAFSNGFYARSELRLRQPANSGNEKESFRAPFTCFYEYCDGAAAKEPMQLFTKNTGLC